MVKIGPTVAEMPAESHPAAPIAPALTRHNQASPCSAAATSRQASSPNGSKGRGSESGSHNPRMAAAAAITGHLTDVRDLMGEMV